MTGWRWGRLRRAARPPAALPSPAREHSASQWTKSGTARWVSPPPPTSSRLSEATWDPNVPAPLRGAPGRRATARGQRALQVDNCACWAQGRPGQGLKPERHRRRAKFAEQGLPGYPHRGLQAPSPFPAGPGAWDTDQPRDVPTGVSVWMGGARSRSPQTPQSPTLAVRVRRARRSRANSWIGSWKPRRPLLSPGAPRQTRGGRSGCLVCFPSTPLAKLSPEAGSPGFPRQPRPPPWVHRPPRPAARASLRAPGRPARTLRCWRREPRASLPGSGTHGAQGSGPLPAGPRSSELRTGAPTRLSEHPCGRSQGAGRGPFICSPEESAFQPSPAPTHSRTHPHPGAGRVAHLSPKSC